MTLYSVLTPSFRPVTKFDTNVCLEGFKERVCQTNLAKDQEYEFYYLGIIGV